MKNRNNIAFSFAGQEIAAVLKSSRAINHVNIDVKTKGFGYLPVSIIIPMSERIVEEWCLLGCYAVWLL
jgi:hypothetical protein